MAMINNLEAEKAALATLLDGVLLPSTRSNESYIKDYNNGLSNPFKSIEVSVKQPTQRKSFVFIKLLERFVSLLTCPFTLMFSDS